MGPYTLSFCHFFLAIAPATGAQAQRLPDSHAAKATRRRRLRVLRCLLLGLLFAGAMHAQPQPEPLPRPGPLRFYHQNEESISQTMAILQDHEGFMWFGDMAGTGLTRYDGHIYTNFRTDPYDSLSLTGGSVNALFEDNQHVLWVGTDEGLNRFDRYSETFQRFQHDSDDPQSLGQGRVNAILEDRQGKFWVATGGGLNRFDRETAAFTHYLPDSTDTRIGPLLEDQQGVLWAGSWGLCQFDPSTGTFTRYLPDPSRPRPGASNASNWNWVNAIHEDPRGRLWVGTWTGGLYLFDRETKSFTNYRHDPSRPLPFASDNIRAIVDDPEGGLWLATRREGLLWFDPETGAMTAYRQDALDPHSLSGDRVISLYRDRQGVIWVGSWGQDVDRFDRAARPFKHYYALPSGNGGLAYPHVQTMTETPEGALWIINGDPDGSGEIALTRIDPGAETYLHFRHDPDTPGSLSLNAIRVFVDATGAVWTGGDVLSRMDPGRPGHFTHFRHDPDDKLSLPPGRVHSLYEDTHGHLWVGSTNFGLSRVDDRDRGLFTRFPLGEDTDNNLGNVTSIVEDARGMFWVSANRAGIFRFDPETGRYENYRHDPDDPNSLAGNQVQSIYVRPQEPGVLWLGVYPLGLGRFDPERGTFRLYTTDDGLPDNGAQGVLGDEQGHLWISTDVGLSRFDPETEDFSNYDVDDGLQGEVFSWLAYHKGRSGRLYFGGQQGFNAFYPHQIRDNPHPPQVVLTKLRLGREMVEPNPDGPLKTRLAETTELTLTHDQNDLTLFYEGLHFRLPEKNRYKYMLDGYDDTWGEETFIRQATYTNLPPGTYTFRVTASNSDGAWNDEGVSLAITILPPWWKTWWAYLLYGMLGVGAAAQAFRWQRNRVVRREREAARERELEQAREIEHAHAELQRAHGHLQATQSQLIQAEKMASLGQLTAGIAHEIKNPLNFVNNFAEVNEELSREAKEALRSGDLAEVEALLDDVATNASVIAHHGKRADGIVRAMMQHASGATGQREETNLNALVSEYIDLAYDGKRVQVQDLTVEIERDLAGAVGDVEIVPQEIGRVVLNLLGNAFDAGEERRAKGEEGYVPTVTVSTCRRGDSVEIRVADNGVGIPDDVRKRIFEPFFTTKPTGSGTGLGLSLAYDIVTQGHGGTLAVESAEGEGATFVVTLPG